MASKKLIIAPATLEDPMSGTLGPTIMFNCTLGSFKLEPTVSNGTKQISFGRVG